MSWRSWLAPALLLVACGPAAPPAPLAPRIEGAAWAPPAWHPAGAVLVGTARAQHLAAALAPLLDPGVPEAVRGPAARLHAALQAVPWASLGLSSRRPVSFSLRASAEGESAAALETLEAALAGLVAGEPLEALPALPPAWLHLRLVGAAAPSGPGADAQLAAWLGGHQRFALTEAPEAAALALGLPEEALAALAPLGGSRLYHLLDTDLPVLLRLDGSGDAAVVDVIVDLSLGERAFADALLALPERRAQTPYPRGPAPGAAGERASSTAGGRASPYAAGRAPLPAAAALEAALELAGYAALVRAAALAAAAWPVLGANPLREDPGPVLARSVAGARARIAPLAGASGTVQIALAARRLTVEGPSGGAPAANAAPGLGLVALEAVGAFALRYAPPPAPAPAAPPAPAAAPAPPPDLAARLAALRGCGAACLPAAWLELRALLGAGPGALAGLLPPDHPLAAALPGLQGLGLALDAAGQPRLTALTVGDPLPWAAALPEVGLRRAVPGGTLLLGGEAALVAGAGAAPLTAPDALLRASGALGSGRVALSITWAAAPRLELALIPAPTAPAP